MRILLVTWFYPPRMGGSEKMAERLVGSLAALGHTVEVWTARQADAPRLERPAPGILVRRFLFGIPWGPLFGVSVFLQSAWSVFRARSRFDILHSQQTSWGALGALAVRRFVGFPVVTRVASSGSHNDIKRVGERTGGRLLIRFVKRADAVVVLSRIARDEVIRYGHLDPSRIVTIPNGVDLSQFPFCPSEPSPGANLLYVGRFNVLKGVDVLVRALAEVKSMHRGVRLSLLGEGEQREELKILAGELGLTWASGDSPQADSADIIFHGLQSDTIPFYRAADVVVLPSRTEGMSNVMVEAMALGKAIVATTVGANGDLLGPGDARSALPAEKEARPFVAANGVLVPPENPRTLAEGIRTLLADPALRVRLGTAARAYAEAHCGLESVARRYSELYESLIARNRR